MSAESKLPRPTREEIAQREIGRTDVSPGLARLLTVLFLFTLAIPPAVQLASDLTTEEPRRVPSCLELFGKLPTVARVYEQTDGSAWQKLTTANRHLRHDLDEYERQLEDRSLLTRHLLGPTQHALTAWTGLGNEKVYVGRDGWLFYRPDVDYLTGPGFLGPAMLLRRKRAGSDQSTPSAPDPRPAILEFHEHLARRGITLIVMPTPGKAAIHPDKLSSRIARSAAPLKNRSFDQFQRELQAAGVLVFDPAPLLAERAKASPESSQFLQVDTHWTPAAIQFVADQLAVFIDHNCPLPEQSPAKFVEHANQVEHLGDTAVMLHLPADQSLFARESVAIRQITGPNGMAWTPDEAADVLLLGDSFTNIFSLPEMKWGTGAGLAEQLAFALQRPVDRLAQNDGGAHGVRQSLQREMAGGRDRFALKRVVIWQFAARELAFGDWKRIPLPERGSTSSDGVREFGKDEVLIQGTVRAAAGAPQPGSVPYREAVTALHLDEVWDATGEFKHREIVVYLWGLRDNQLTPAARFTPGQKISLRVVPWSAVSKQYERFNRIELDDPDFRLVELPTYWGEVDSNHSPP
jgi:alginate O-acetyltransferase complex protein AlgJ